MANISIIAALDRNRLIGMDNKLPWRIPEDLAYFRAKTLNHTVIMGRKTWLSMCRAIELRTNIVLTRDHSLSLSRYVVVHDIAELDNYLEEEENFVIGGASIFKQFIPLANRLFLTRIDAEFTGDTHFPDYNEEDWELDYFEQKTSSNGYMISFNEYKRIQKGGSNA
jgi:dihydrofolate reductase